MEKQMNANEMNSFPTKMKEVRMRCLNCGDLISDSPVETKEIGKVIAIEREPRMKVTFKIVATLLNSEETVPIGTEITIYEDETGFGIDSMFHWIYNVDEITEFIQ